LRTLLIVVVLFSVGLGWFAFKTLGLAPFSEPPRVGERAQAIIERLGTPHFDSRKNGDPDTNYRLGYTDGLGTRHHLVVVDGVVVKIEYSSR